jgi:MFS family permease
MVVASMMTGILTARIGYYTPFLIVGVCLMSIGAGLLTTLQVDTDEGKWLGYQILYGFGMGLSFQAPNLAAQTVLPTRDVPIGTSLMFFSQLLGGAVFISVGQNVLNNQLLTRLSAVPGFDVSSIAKKGATTLTEGLPAEMVGPVLEAYNESLRKVFQVGLILVCLTIFGAASMEWRSVKEKKPTKKTDPEQGDAVAAEGRHSDADTAVDKSADTEKEEGRVMADGTEKETAAAAEPLPVSSTTKETS